MKYLCMVFYDEKNLNGLSAAEFSAEYSSDGLLTGFIEFELIQLAPINRRFIPNWKRTSSEIT
jgi:hypothetical protein